MKGTKNVALLGWGHVHIKNFGKLCTALSIWVEKNSKTAFPKETAHCNLGPNSQFSKVESILVVSLVGSQVLGIIFVIVQLLFLLLQSFYSLALVHLSVLYM